MSVYFVGGDEHYKHGFVPIACDVEGRARLNFSSPFEAGVLTVICNPGGPFPLLFVSEIDMGGFTVTVVDKEGKPEPFVVGEVNYKATGWCKEDEERWPAFDVPGVTRSSRQSGESVQQAGAPTASKIDNMNEESMQMDDGGVGSVLTREQFEEIKRWFGAWEEEAYPRAWALIHEIERLHPEWEPSRFRVSQEVVVEAEDFAEARRKFVFLVDNGRNATVGRVSG